MTHQLAVLVHTPVHSAVAGTLSYVSELPLTVGSLVRVPLGQRELLGVVWDAPLDSPAASFDPQKLRPISSALDGIAPLSASWRQLVTFAAHYYQRSVGEVALAALPPQLRDLSTQQWGRRLKRHAKAGAVGEPALVDASELVALSPEQTGAIAQFNTNSGPFLLFGATGSGKTEVYLQCVEQLLVREPDAQAMVMVPEINLTPQLEARFMARFAPMYGDSAVVSMHSGMTPAQRLKSWLAAHSGAARIVLGTRMAIFASLPKLKLIIVDEEHDPSYKSGEGARYSARDLAVYRGRLDGAKVMLGSATPSLESWHHSRAAAEGGRYLRLVMPSRIGSITAPPPAQGDTTLRVNDATAASAGLPVVRRVDMNHQPKHCVFSPPLLAAIMERIARGEQSMVFLNRRGYAPVLHCADCDWKSECPHCSAYRVFHKIDRTLRCHHCGYAERVPRACPACGNPDIAPMGRGTERLEEHLAELLLEVRRPNSVSDQWPEGEPVRIVRIDADSTKLKGELQAQLARVHSGEVDVLVGTQMIAKGHDFRRITLVAAINPDNALFSSDFRAPERLFSLLMQAAGRAGRDADISGQSEMWVQTFHPQHPLFEALKRHDYPAFAAEQLKEREQAGMPPFSFQALVRAEARTQEVAQGFLSAASAAATQMAQADQLLAHLTLYPAVPMSIQRVANVERAQMLIESPSRAALQRFLAAWQVVLHATRKQPEGRGLLRWAIDVDPLAI
ncbi:primosomal protein N' [Rhodoferax ferrireducens]|uniref:replication restart helicase PriA n=1 Tax=Rhodoferax ferrireducens TaxID=192843 RepID=UPI00298EBD0A|nr:primosomal protein N' [Rhodoferax ferrireducens]WPC67794.1 primosomal protein N' [Rhodoferax ferrireducens]